MSAPESFRAGDSVTWTESLPAYPASLGWALAYRLLWATGSAVDIATAASGDDHVVNLTAADTAAWLAGAATLVSWVELGSQRVTLAQQPVSILPDLTSAATYDGRSQAEKGLADAKAALADYVASGKAHVAGYTIAGRQMQFRDVEQIRHLIAHYERAVAGERALRAVLDGGTPGRVLTRF